jgi:intracellular multiplication protein IcmG
MADNNQNDDEYKFAELDSLDNDPMNEMSDTGGDASSALYVKNAASSQKDIKRNALIAVGLIIFAMVMYKLIGYLFFSPKNTPLTQTTITPITQATSQPVEYTPPPLPAPVQQTPPISSENNTDLTNKISAMEVSQDSVRSEVNTVSQQVGTVNNNINTLNNQMNELNQTITNLSAQMAKQTEEINILMARMQPKKISKPITRPATRPLIYYIQAVIPGRAWLIGTNGSTLTVREGTKITGYGMVKLIDAMQGRVITSSGQVIRFSQEDS